MSSVDEFAALQSLLPAVLATDRPANRTQTVFVIPSFTVDRDLLERVPSMEFWEHRMLFLLARLRDPSVRMVFLTSQRISSQAIEYYVDLIPGLAQRHMDRLTLVECKGPSSDPLAAKLLRSPETLSTLRAAAAMTDDAYIEPFVSTELERDLAVALGLPLNGSDPALSRFGLKSCSRALFRDLGIRTPPGVEGVLGLDAVAQALVELKEKTPRLRRAVVKLDDSLAGMGNALFSFDEWPGRADPVGWARRRLRDGLELAFPVIDRERFIERLEQNDCIVEHHIEGAASRSPSVQCEIDPLGEVNIVSTHDQQMSGEAEQHFAGCVLPAEDPAVLHDAARALGGRLSHEGVVGPFGVDFLSIRRNTGLEHYALEINLRNVGTFHHLATLHNLTGGGYDVASGQFVTANGNVRAYYGSDSVRLETLTGLSAAEVLSGAANEGLVFDAATETGVVLHMIDAAYPFGRVGITCVGRNIDHARATYHEAIGRLALLSGGT